MLSTSIGLTNNDLRKVKDDFYAQVIELAKYHPAPFYRSIGKL